MSIYSAAFLKAWFFGSGALFLVYIAFFIPKPLPPEQKSDGAWTLIGGIEGKWAFILFLLNFTALLAWSALLMRAKLVVHPSGRDFGGVLWLGAGLTLIGSLLVLIYKKEMTYCLDAEGVAEVGRTMLRWEEISELKADGTGIVIRAEHGAVLYVYLQYRSLSRALIEVVERAPAGAFAKEKLEKPGLLLLKYAMFAYSVLFLFFAYTAWVALGRGDWTSILLSIGMSTALPLLAYIRRHHWSVISLEGHSFVLRNVFARETHLLSDLRSIRVVGAQSGCSLVLHLANGDEKTVACFGIDVVALLRALKDGARAAGVSLNLVAAG